MILKATVDELGRITIPEELRRSLGWQPGCVLSIEQHEDRLVVQLVATEDFVGTTASVAKNGHRRSLRGILRNPNGPSFPTEEALQDAIAASHRDHSKLELFGDLDAELSPASKK